MVLLRCLRRGYTGKVLSIGPDKSGPMLKITEKVVELMSKDPSIPKAAVRAMDKFTVRSIHCAHNPCRSANPL